MKLELKHLAPYLPFSLEGVKNKGYRFYVNSVYNKDFENDSFKSKYPIHGINSNGTINCSLDEFKPILRPLKSLSKNDIDFMYFDIISTDNDMYGTRDEFEDYFNETGIDHLPVCLYNYLVSKHFDIFGLINKGLAIDINTVSS